MKPEKILDYACMLAYAHWGRDSRKRFSVAAVAKRSSGPWVCSVNSSSVDRAPRAHAECRIVGKLDRGVTVYVARPMADGTWGMAKPCPGCRIALRAFGVKKVYYTISQGNYGVMVP